MIDVARRLHVFSIVLVAALSGSCAHRAAVTPTPTHEPTVTPTPPAAIGPAVVPPSSRVLRIVRPANELPSPIFSVKIDDKRVFFNDGAGRLWSAPKDGSAVASLLVNDPHDAVRSFVIVSGTIYYASRNELRSISVIGGPTTLLNDNHAGPLLVVTDGHALYHTVFDGSGTFRWSLDTKRAERFCAGGKHQTLAVDETNLYIASYSAGTITAVSKKTRRARILASGARRPVRLVVDAGYVYFACEGDGTVRRVAKRGGPVDILARGQKSQEHLARDDGHIYWTTRIPGGHFALMRAPSVPTPGSAPETLYSGLTSASGLTIDGTFVYVADRGAGQVVRVAKASSSD